MLTLDVKIHRAQRFVRMLEEDAPLLDARLAPLNAERQRVTKAYAAELRAQAQAELERLLEQDDSWDANDPTPQAAD